jgi:integrase
MDTIPLHQVALSLGKIIAIGPIDNLLALERKEWSEYPYETIEKSVETAIEYYKWLQKRTLKYKDLPIDLIPQAIVRTRSLKSATAGEGKKQVNAVRAILAQVGLKPSSNLVIRPFKQSKLILPDQADWFLSTLKSSQDKLIFFLLRYFGIRASEVASLRVNPSTIPNLRDPIAAKELIKKQLLGNIKWDKFGGFWFIQIEESKTNNGIRTIPFLAAWGLEQDWLTHLIYESLFERQALIETGLGKNSDHGYLFVSRHHAYRGQPITGESVLKKFNYLASKLASKDDCKYDLTNGYSPHSFRHLFATLLILQDPQDDARITLLMGHGSTVTTKRIYFHIFEAAKHSSSKDGNQTVKDMLETFAAYSSKSEQYMKEFLYDYEDL